VLIAQAVMLAVAVPGAGGLRDVTPEPIGDQAPSPQRAEGGDIVVTAQRRPAAQKDVPASIDVLSRERLIDTNIRTFEGLARIDTALEIAAYQGETQLFLRGVGAVTFIGGFDSSVAVYADGVYLSRPSAIAPALFDVDRVEVLNGPQGSLYGRNATAGAINLVSRGPGGEWRGEASATVGNYSTVDVFAGVEGPITPNLSFRLAVGTGNHSGYTTLYYGRSADGRAITRHAEDRHDLTSRLSLRWQAAPAVTVDIAADYFRADDRAVVFHFSGPGYANNPLFQSRIATGELGTYRSRRVSTSIVPYNHPENWGIRGTTTVDLGSNVLTWTSAYRRTRPGNYDDLTNSTVLGESQFKQERSRQLTQDLQLASGPSQTRLRYVVGASYFRERNAIRNEFFFPYLAGYLGGQGQPDCCLLKANGSTSTDAFAVFGDATLAVVPKLAVTVGGRYAAERRSGTNLLDFVGFALQNDARFAPAWFHSFTPKVGLEYRPTEQALVYATASRGFKAGGFNVGSTQNTPYRPESIWSYEVGAKLDLGRATQISMSAFHYDYTDMQVQDVAANTVLIRNAASAKVDGVEANLQVRPTDSLRLDASATFLDARFDQYRTVNTKTPQLGILDLSGNPLPQAPGFKAHGGVERSFTTDGGWDLRFRGDATWQDRIYFSAFKDPRATQPAYWWLKARLTVVPPAGRYDVAAFVDNLSNTRAFTNISITGDLDGSRGSGNLALPRTYGLQLNYRL
jgi:iron complex outermembrane receptor protein